MDNVLHLPIKQLPLPLTEGEDSALHRAYEKTRLSEHGITYQQALSNDAMLRCLRNVAGVL